MERGLPSGGALPERGGKKSREIMKQQNHNALLAVILAMAVSFAFSVRAADNLQVEAQRATANFENIDPTISQYLNSAYAYAVFPGVGKGGFIIGGARGKGVVYEKGRVIGEATLTQASIGAQAGGQSFDEIIFFQSQQALEEFKSGNFEMGADVSAVIAAEGAAKTAKYNHGVAVFALPKKGAMVQASVGGQKFKYTPLSE